MSDSSDKASKFICFIIRKVANDCYKTIFFVKFVIIVYIFSIPQSFMLSCIKFAYYNWAIVSRGGGLERNNTTMQTLRLPSAYNFPLNYNSCCIFLIRDFHQKNTLLVCHILLAYRKNLFFAWIFSNCVFHINKVKEKKS